MSGESIGSGHMRISMVIPTLNAGDELWLLMDMLLRQTVVPDEILVVDSASDDNTRDIAAACPGVRVMRIERAEFNHGLTRHRALLETSGDIVCYMTQDAIPADEHYIEALVTPFDDPAVALVSGRQLPKADARRFEQLVRNFNYPAESNVRSAADIPRLGIKAFFASDACSAYRRETYMSCGGFAEVETNEDMLMAARFVNAGYKVAYAADACVFHSHNLTPGQQYRRNKAVGAFLEQHGGELCCASETGEGMKLVREVVSHLFKEARPVELAAFGVDCAARLMGNRAGRASVRKQSGCVALNASYEPLKTASVAMAACNGAQYIKEQIESILWQLAEDDELVISYDDSSDATYDIIKSYAAHDSRVRIVLNNNPGIVGNFNNAIEACRNDVIFICDQDDVWLEGKRSKCMDALNETGADLLVHNAVHVDAELNPVLSDLFTLYRLGPGLLKNFAKPRCSGCTMAFPRSALDMVMPLPESVINYDNWISIVCELDGEICFLDDVLLAHRLHGGNATVSRRPLTVIAQQRGRIAREYVARRTRRMLAGVRRNWK